MCSTRTHLTNILCHFFDFSFSCFDLSPPPPPRNPGCPQQVIVVGRVEHIGVVERVHLCRTRFGACRHRQFITATIRSVFNTWVAQRSAQRPQPNFSSAPAPRASAHGRARLPPRAELTRLVRAGAAVGLRLRIRGAEHVLLVPWRAARPRVSDWTPPALVQTS